MTPEESHVVHPWEHVKQPLSFIGLPVLSVPIQRPDTLPLGVQIVAAPYNEAQILRVAAVLETKGVVAAPVVQHQEGEV